VRFEEWVGVRRKGSGVWGRDAGYGVQRHLSAGVHWLPLHAACCMLVCGVLRTGGGLQTESALGHRRHSRPAVQPSTCHLHTGVEVLSLPIRLLPRSMHRLFLWLSGTKWTSPLPSR
jgi:hypothetical protein